MLVSNWLLFLPAARDKEVWGGQNTYWLCLIVVEAGCQLPITLYTCMYEKTL